MSKPFLFSQAVLITFSISFFAGCQPQAAEPAPPEPSTGNVIFIHPDGYSLQGWQAYRALRFGPDGNTAWDLLPEVGIYRAHVRNSLSPTSNAGATIHGYGVKVGRDSYGLDEGQTITTPSGKTVSIMTEAIQHGIRSGIVNSGHLAEPGTGAMLAQVEKRSNQTGIVRQFLESGADVILGGGETLFLPRGTTGVHGQEGVREDNLNLVAEFEKAGYHVVYTLEELAALPDDTPRVLGLFAANNTYNDLTEEALREANLPAYNPNQPTVAEMTRHALRILSHGGRQFFLMVEEEGTDNFGNANNASGLFEAYRRADDCIAAGRDFISNRHDTLLLTAADSDASGMQLIALESMYGDFGLQNGNVPPASSVGAPLDGVNGARTKPFTSAPDRNGKQFQFAVAWPTRADVPGGVLARAEGFRADALPLNVDNTQLYPLIYEVLFGHPPSP